ncbi:MAG TPA: TIGR01459 family HAD-type hydrolase [Xanthobacteraceae bacterium]|nr:TIGR01459 family HAD-type hydrolase [Xanthobacteraceae bacterium]
MLKSPAVPPVVTGLAPFAARYDVFLCDVWGVVHNGVAAFPAANDALIRARAAGVTVIMVSNAPRPGAVVKKQVARYGVPDAAYDDIIASGDVTREELRARPGARVFHLGTERDLPNYEGLDVTLVDLDHADLVVCTGPFHDETETPDDYRELMAKIRARDLLLICANPDIVVERGNRLIWCAGALAAIYDELGGKTIYAGKPYAPIYHTTLARAAALRGKKEVSPSRVLAIGDGLRTDLLGAARQGIDCLFITRGIHAADLGFASGEIDREKLAQAFAETGAAPLAIMHELIW